MPHRRLKLSCDGHLDCTSQSSYSACADITYLLLTRVYQRPILLKIRETIWTETGKCDGIDEGNQDNKKARPTSAAKGNSTNNYND
ncbi:hypothetical protein ES702_01835 [subsurface metagenome]